MVYGAQPGNPVPLDEDAPLLSDAPSGLLGDWLGMERAAAQRRGLGEDLQVVSVRPASLVGSTADSLLPGLFEAVRLLAVRDGRCHWQFCHTDDLAAALVNEPVQGQSRFEIAVESKDDARHGRPR